MTKLIELSAALAAVKRCWSPRHGDGESCLCDWCLWRRRLFAALEKLPGREALTINERITLGAAMRAWIKALDGAEPDLLKRETQLLDGIQRKLLDSSPEQAEE